VLFSAEDRALNKNLHQFEEILQRGWILLVRGIYRQNLWRKTEKEGTGHFTEKDLGNRTPRTHSYFPWRQTKLCLQTTTQRHLL